jgi:predicted nucleotidyltransferase
MAVIYLIPSLILREGGCRRMHKLCRIDIGRGKEIYKEIDNKLNELAKKLRVRYNVSKIIVFGSYARSDLNEGSDIDLVILADFKAKFHKRIPAVLGLTDLPIEPWCYTEGEFRAMIIDKNNFITEVLKEGKRIF